MNEWSLGEMLVDGIRKSLFYGLAIFLILMLIPATREMFMKFVGVVGGETGTRVFNTVIYLIKGIYKAHVTLIWHLFNGRKQVFLSPDESQIGGAAKEKIKT